MNVKLLDPTCPTCGKPPCAVLELVPAWGPITVAADGTVQFDESKEPEVQLDDIWVDENADHDCTFKSPEGHQWLSDTE